MIATRVCYSGFNAEAAVSDSLKKAINRALLLHIPGNNKKQGNEDSRLRDEETAMHTNPSKRKESPTWRFVLALFLSMPLILLFCASQVFAYSVSGAVLDASGSLPIQGASVTIRNISAGTDASGSTAISGNYQVDVGQSGYYEIHSVSKFGYREAFPPTLYQVSDACPNVTASNVYLIKLFQVNLQAGWNLVGWVTGSGYIEAGSPQPAATEYASGGALTIVPSLSDALVAIGLDSSTNVRVVGPAGKVFVRQSGVVSPYNTLKSLLPGRAYRIYLEGVKTIALPGLKLGCVNGGAALVLPVGWVEVAYWGPDGLTLQNAYEGISGAYDAIIDGNGNTPASMFQTQGYLVHGTTANQVLHYPCQ
jgi:hypothetical protein